MQTVKIIKDYFDIRLNRGIYAGSDLTTDDERAEALIAAGIAVLKQEARQSVFDDSDEEVVTPKKRGRKKASDAK